MNLIRTREPAYSIQPPMQARLENDFTFHAPHGDQADRYEEIRLTGRLFSEFLCYTCPPSRELSMALTHIDEAVMCSIAAIARNEKPTAACKPSE